DSDSYIKNASNCTPMSFIEPRTLVFLVSLLTALSALILLAMRHSFSPTVKGLSCWTAGTWTFLGCSLLFSFRGMLHPLLDVVLANFLLILSFTLLVKALLNYQGRNLPHTGLIGMAILAFTALVAWFTFVDHNFQLRLVLVSTAVG